MTVDYFSSDEEASASEPEPECTPEPAQPSSARHVRMDERVVVIGSAHPVALRSDAHTRLRAVPGRSRGAERLDAAIAAAATPAASTRPHDLFADYPCVPAPASASAAPVAESHEPLFAGLRVLLTGLRTYAPRTSAAGRVVGVLAAHGAVLADGAAIAGAAPGAAPLVLLSDRAHRTPTYLRALAAHVPCLHYHWALHSAHAHCCLPWRAYVLPAACDPLTYPAWLSSSSSGCADDKGGPRLPAPVAPRPCVLAGLTLAFCARGVPAAVGAQWEALAAELGATVAPQCAAGARDKGAAVAALVVLRAGATRHRHTVCAHTVVAAEWLVRTAVLARRIDMSPFVLHHHKHH